MEHPGHKVLRVSLEKTEIQALPEHQEHLELLAELQDLLESPEFPV